MKNLKVKVIDEQHLEKLSENIGIELRPNLKELNLDVLDTKYKPLKKIKQTKRIKQWWEEYWVDMPFYTNNKKQEYFCEFDLIFDESNIEYVSQLFEQNISHKSKYIYYPNIRNTNLKHRALSNEGNNQYPIYIVSKGRYDNCLTANTLIRMDVDFFIIVEEQEYELYCKFYDKEKILILPVSYKEEYDVFDEDTGVSKSTGPGAARNFAWDHSIQNGHKWHWVIDDNIQNFYYLDCISNKRLICLDNTPFATVEMFIDRYDNIAISGLNYMSFVVPTGENPPITKNTRIYSILLIRNDIPYRWRGRYNEDTDLSLRVLKDGWSTVQFNIFMGDKMATQRLKGGNSEEFYFKEGTLPKSKMLYDMHPDVTKLVYKFGRWHHEVDYSHYKNNTFGNFSLNEDKRKDLKIHLIEVDDAFLKNKYKNKYDVYDIAKWSYENIKKENIVRQLKISINQNIC